MKDEQVNTFYKEIAAVCGKYNIGLLIGQWFSQDTDLYGLVKVVDLKDLSMVQVGNHIAEKIEKWSDELGATKHKDRVQEIIIGIK